TCYCRRLRAVSLLPLSRLPPPLHPFPTRRSSDLNSHRRQRCAGLSCRARRTRRASPPRGARATAYAPTAGTARSSRDTPAACGRSEEHTSELQSRVDLVCRLLLEKKKNEVTDDTT